MFIDRAKIRVRGGGGGNGVTAFRREKFAPRGRHGEGSNCSGREGEDLTVRVPVGTQIFDSETGEFLQDLATDQSRWLAARGGRGGVGNSHFATSINRAPRY